MGVPIPDTGSVTEDTGVSGGNISTSGDVDYLFGDDTGEWTAETITGSYGSQLVIDDDGNWTYTADNSNVTIQALDTGETLTEVFTVTSNNGTTTITITINGQDEPPCFVAGTLIDTPFGPRAVEDLRAGDRVLTRDQGEQVIRWAGARQLTFTGAEDFAKLQPIRLRKDSLGPGMPDRDVFLSPMHRVVVRDPLVGLLTGNDEVMCPVRALVNGRSIVQETWARVSYHHLLLDDHQVLTSSGCDSESFYPGRIGLEGFADDTREEVLSLFPELRSLPDSYGPAARRIARGHEATLLSDSLTPADGFHQVLKKRVA